MSENTSTNATLPVIKIVFQDPSIAEKASLLLLSVLGFAVNFCICVTILSFSALRKRPTHLYVVSFCVTHLLVAGGLLPLFCYFQQNPAYDHLSALVVVLYASHLVAVTYERLQAVCNSLRYHEVIDRSKVIKTIIFCWLTSVIVQSLPFLWAGVSSAMVIHKIFLVCILVVFLLLPLVFICYTYCVIYIQVQSLLKRDKSRVILTKSDEIKLKKFGRAKLRAESKTAFVFGMVALTYALAWFPVIFMTFLDVVDRKDIEPAILKDISAFLIGLNSVTDALIYGIMLKDVRRCVKNFFSKKKSLFS